MKRKLSGFVVFLIMGILIWNAWTYHQSRGMRIITWDVYGYYLYLPALFIYQDCKTYQFTEDHFQTYQPSTNFYQLNPHSEGVKAPIYTMGQALVWSPFFFGGHLWAKLDGRYPADGLSAPYQWAIWISAMVFALLGMIMVRAVLRRYFEDWLVAVVLAVLFLGTNLLHYTCFDIGLTHSYLFALYAALLYLIPNWYERPKMGNSLLLGLLMGLICLIRPSELILVLLVGLFGVSTIPDVKNRLSHFLGHPWALAWVLVGGIVAVLPQILFWKWQLGLWIYNGYVGHHFDFWSPHIWEGLFSYRKGWLLYTPIMTLALVGLIPMWWQLREWRWGIILFLGLNIYIVYSWHIWWYASTYGSRAMVQSYAILALPLGAMLHSVFRAHKFWQVLLAAFLVACIGLNLFQNWQYVHRILPMDETTKTYYWKVFGKSQLPSADVVKYMDVDYALPPGAYEEVLLGHKSASKDTLANILDGKMAREVVSFSESLEWILREEEADTWSHKWVKVEAEVRTIGTAFGKWNVGKLVLSIDRNGESLHYSGVRFQRYIKPEKWTKVHFEVPLPTLLPGDVVRVFVWNDQSGDRIFYHQFQLTRLDTK